MLSIPSVGQRATLQHTLHQQIGFNSIIFFFWPIHLFLFGRRYRKTFNLSYLFFFFHLIESLKVTVHLTYLCSLISWLYAVYTVAARRWQIRSGLCADPCTQHAVRHRAVGRVRVSGCDLPSGVEWGTGADTVSLLTLGRELAPPTECGTYATHSLWLWDVCAGMHTLWGDKRLCMWRVCAQSGFWDIKWSVKGHLSNYY